MKPLHYTSNLAVYFNISLCLLYFNIRLCLLNDSVVISFKIINPVFSAMFMGRLIQQTSRRLLSSSSNEILLTYPESNPGIALLGLNRPPVNAVSLSLGAQLREALAEIKSKKSLQGVILYSTSPKIFCAGADLKERLFIKEEDVPGKYQHF